MTTEESQVFYYKLSPICKITYNKVIMFF